MKHNKNKKREFNPTFNMAKFAIDTFNFLTGKRHFKDKMRVSINANAAEICGKPTDTISMMEGTRELYTSAFYCDTRKDALSMRRIIDKVAQKIETALGKDAERQFRSQVAKYAEG